MKSGDKTEDMSFVLLFRFILGRVSNCRRKSSYSKKLESLKFSQGKIEPKRPSIDYNPLIATNTEKILPSIEGL
jgi:hypothetical protein